jgi:hypothetical protein
MLRIQSSRGAQDTSGPMGYLERQKLRRNEAIFRDFTESQVLVYPDKRLEVNKDCVSKSSLSLSKRFLYDDEEVAQDD